MARQLYVRIVGALGLLALAALFVGIDPFLSAGASLSSQTPAVSVNRTLKGDRLPAANSAILDVPDGQTRFARQPSTETRAQTPFACDPAVSLIRSPNSPPPSANVYRRCMA
ncbi:MAG TPA: hypothetical protein VHT51_08345 [Micropepsaceae bacterium]|jgi:hypothetical protein|nr:hypothetical protein [Micropepsaceae bacterium]